MLPAQCFIVGMVRSFLQKWCLAFKPTSSILVSQDQSILFLMVWESLGAFWQAPSWLSCAFYWGVASIWPLYHKGLIGGVLQRWLSFRNILPSPHWVLGHLTDYGPFPPIAQFGQVASSKKSLCGSKRLPFKNDGGHCVIGDLQCCRHVLVPFTRSVPRHNPVSKIYRQFLRPHGLVFLRHALSSVGPYIDRYVPIQIMSNKCNLPLLDSSQVVETSQGWSKESGCTWA